ncbi:MAG: hypothetical protein ABSC34_04215 [Acidimicrobiales bacterium]
MIKRIIAGLGVVMAFVGVWMLSQGHSQEAACNASAARLGAAATSLVCPRAVSTYFIGVALTMGGLIVTGLILFAIVKQIRAVTWIEKAPDIATQHQRVIGTAFGTDRKVTTVP